jgi:Na+/proline symporter
LQSHFWLRTFSARSDKDLWLGISGAMVGILIIVTLVGCTGLVAVWAGVYPGTSDEASVPFFALLQQLPNWVVGIVVVMSVTLSTAAFDSLQTAMITTASNDLFRNRLNIWYIRAGVVLIMVPVVVIAIRAPSILQIYLISDLISAATIPVLVLGLSDYFYWWRGFEVVVGGLGGLFTVFLFGTVYYGDAKLGGELLLLQQGLYTADWGAFGAFVAAPVGGILWGFGALGLRLGIQYFRAKKAGTRFNALDRPQATSNAEVAAVSVGEDVESGSDAPGISKSTGKFF